jgi:hypothetical protein
MSYHNRYAIELRCNLLGVPKSEEALAEALVHLQQTPGKLKKFISIIRIFERVSVDKYDLVKSILSKELELTKTEEITFHVIYCKLTTKTLNELRVLLRVVLQNITCV